MLPAESEKASYSLDGDDPIVFQESNYLIFDGLVIFAFKWHAPQKGVGLAPISCNSFRGAYHSKSGCYCFRGVIRLFKSFKHDSNFRINEIPFQHNLAYC